MKKLDKSILIPVIIAIILLIALFSYLVLQWKNNPKKVESVKPAAISEYANRDTTVSYLVDGIINGDESHRAIKITVSKENRLIEILSGYQYIPIESKSYVNNVAAYEPFLASLQVAGFTKEKSNPKITNPEGICPLGNRYFFSSTGIPEISSSLWSSNCASPGLFMNRSSQGTFNGNLNTIQQLFENQIPDYSALTKNVKL